MDTPNPTYGSISQMLYQQGASSELIQGYSARAEKSYALKHLVELRHRQSKTQKEVAVGMGCTQSRLSKIEANTDEELTVGQLSRYAATLDYRVVITLIPNTGSRSDEVFFHACEIDRIIQGLAPRGATPAGAPSFTESLHQLSLMLETNESPRNTFPSLTVQTVESPVSHPNGAPDCPKCGPAKLDACVMIGG